MQFHVHHYHDHDPQIEGLLRGIGRKLDEMKELIMASLDEMKQSISALSAEVGEETTIVASVATLIDGLNERLKNAVATAADLDDLKSQVTNIMTAAVANKQVLAQKVQEGTPAQPAAPA